MMGEGAEKKALIDLGRFSNQVLHGLSMPPGLLGQGLEHRMVVLGLGPQRLLWGLDQAPSELEGSLLKREGILYGCQIRCLGGIENLLKIPLLSLVVHHFSSAPFTRSAST